MANQWEVGERIEKGDIWSTLQQQNDGIQRGLGTEMSTQRYDEVIDTIRGIVRRKNDGLVLPLILLGISITAVLTDLSTRILKTASSQ